MSTALVFTGFPSFLTLQREAGWGRWEGRCLRPAGVASCGENVRLGPGKIAFSSRAPSSWVRAVFCCFWWFSGSISLQLFLFLGCPQRRALAGVVCYFCSIFSSCVLRRGTGPGPSPWVSPWLVPASLTSGHTWPRVSRRVFYLSFLPR